MRKIVPMQPADTEAWKDAALLEEIGATLPTVKEVMRINTEKWCEWAAQWTPATMEPPRKLEEFPDENEGE